MYKHAPYRRFHLSNKETDYLSNRMLIVPRSDKRYYGNQCLLVTSRGAMKQ